MKTFQRFIAEAYRVSEISKQQVQEVAFLAPLAAGLSRVAGGAALRSVGGAAVKRGLRGELKDLAIQSVKDKMLDRFTNGQQPPESTGSEEDTVEPTDGEGTALSKLLKIKEARKFGGMGSISSPVYSIPDDPNFKQKYAEKQRLIAARKRTAEPTKGEKERAEKSAQAIRDNPRPVETPKTVLPGGVDHNLLNSIPTRETKPKSRYAEMPDPNRPDGPLAKSRAERGIPDPPDPNKPEEKPKARKKPAAPIKKQK